MERLEIGPAPYEENCAACGVDEDFTERNRAECKAFAAQLERELGAPPAGAYFTITANHHEFGTYREVAVKYHDDDEDATAYAYKAEEHPCARWDDIARDQLTAAGFAPRN